MKLLSRLGLGLVIFYAVGLPWQISYNILPIPTYTNEFVAISGWGILMLLVGRTADATYKRSTAFLYLSAFFSLAILTVVAQSVSSFEALMSVSLLWLFFLMMAGACAYAGYRIAFSPRLEQFADSFAVCWVLGSCLSFGAQLVQYLGQDVSWYVVAPLSEVGRIYGNIRQPNHLATLLGVGMVCIAWLYARKQIRLKIAVLLHLFLGSAIILTSSRTGLLILGGLFFWSLFRLPKGAERRLIWLAPVCGVAVMLLLFSLDNSGALHYFGKNRLLASVANPSESSGLRFELWRNSLELIRQNWLFGTGVGQFQFYYLLSDLPQPSKTLFTNAHSLPLQAAVELGLPIALALFYLLTRTFWTARNAFTTTLGQCCAAAMAVVAIHSLFEFPLWYAYFLLPTCFLLGIFVGIDAAKENLGHGAIAVPASRSKGLTWAGMVTIALLLTSVPHYMSLAAIYAPGGSKDPLATRLETANNGFIYRHWIVFTALVSYGYPDSKSVKYLGDLFDRNARFFMSDEYLMRYAIVLTHAGRLEEAKRVTYALGALQGQTIFRLKTYCDSQAGEDFKSLSTYIANPRRPLVTASDFRRGT